MKSAFYLEPADINDMANSLTSAFFGKERA
jgi:hypothetical protein